jgi:DNA recombination protein RmuC
MTEPYALILIAGIVVVAILQILLLLKKSGVDLISVSQGLQAVEKSQERMERSVRDELSKNREESATTGRDARVELSGNLKGMGDTLNQQIGALAQTIDQKLEAMRGTVENRLTSIQDDGSKKLEQIRTDSASAAQKAREEVTEALRAFNDSTVNTLKDMGTNQRTQLADVLGQLTKLTETTEKKLEAQKNTVDERLKQIQSESATGSKQLREEMSNALKSFNDSVLKAMTGMADTQQKQLTVFSEQLQNLTDSNQKNLATLRETVETKLRAIQEDNNKQLDQMRATVDEKLQGTLEKRLGESFKLVSDRLEQVHKGLGEMQTLATGVGDLKKVLTNVKTRGTWGEVQLGAMLEQILSPNQYAPNVATKDGGERVEFAIRLPGKGFEKDETVWLPIDAKFPLEDYQRLVEAQEKADPEGADQAGKQLEARIKQCAKDISEKYLSPPKTTDFGILFLPNEGLFAEVIRRIGLSEYVQRQCRVVIAGPTTLWSILNSLQMGFRTLAIEKQSSEVWKILGAVKTEFGTFGTLLDGVKKKLDAASNNIEDAAQKSRTIERKLRKVQELPAAESIAVLGIEPGANDGNRVPEDGV